MTDRNSGGDELRQQVDTDARPETWEDRQPVWTQATVLALAVAILIVAFVWFVIRLDPLTSDFIEPDAPSPTATIDSVDN